MEIRFAFLSLFVLVFVILCCLTCVGTNNPRTKDTVVNIGVIFDKNSDALERAFNYGVEVANTTDLKIRAHRNETDIRNSFNLGYTICEHLDRMVFALLCMSNIESYDVIQTYSQALQVPFIVPSSPKSSRTDRYHYEIKMNPSYIPAMAEFIRFYRWNRIFYLFDKDDDIWRLQQLYDEFNMTSSTITIVARPIYDLTETHDILRSLDKMSSSCDPKVFILDFNTNKTLTSVLRKIIDVGMNRDGYHYLIGGLEIREHDFHMFYHSGAVFTGFQLLNSNRKFYQDFLSKWNVSSRKEDNSVPRFSVDLALMVDGVAVLTTALTRIYKEESESKTLELFRTRLGEFYNTNDTKGILCSAPTTPFQYGHKVIRAMKDTVLSGLSGNIQFNEDGERVNYTLELYQSKHRTKLKKIGSWSVAEGLQIYSNPPPPRSPVSAVKIVTTLLEEPFLMKKKENTNGIPDKKYEGFCVDLLDRMIKTSVNFSYLIVPCKDGEYGQEQSDGTWNGMIGELIRGEADIALAPLTITKKRQQVVDFTKPFMKTGISIMIMRPDKQKPGLFSFKEPLADDVWLCVTVGFLAVSFILFLVGRFSPYEWKNDTATGPSEDFNMLNALWSSLGALMMQGSDFFPRSISGRTAESAWWFFTLILISSYTANLAAFLTVEQLSFPINSIDDLAKQTSIKYGCLEGGSTQNFFKDSGVIVYEEMWRFMQLTNSTGQQVFMKNNEDGWKEVQSMKHKYAFLLEESFNKYFNQRKPCTTMMVGEKINSFGYGIATPRLSPLSQKLNLAVLQLREYGDIIKLEHKWWVAKGQCGGGTGEKGKRSLSLSNVSGIFHILIGGLVLAMVVAILEYAAHRHCQRKKKKKGKYKVQKALNNARKEKPKTGELQPLRPNATANGPQENKGVGYNKYQTSSPANNLITFEGITENGQTQL